jgi:hypothetical protein
MVYQPIFLAICFPVHFVKNAPRFFQLYLTSLSLTRQLPLPLFHPSNPRLKSLPISKQTLPYTSPATSVVLVVKWQMCSNSQLNDSCDLPPRGPSGQHCVNDIRARRQGEYDRWPSLRRGRGFIRMAKILRLNVATWEDADCWLLGWVWGMLLDCGDVRVLPLDPRVFFLTSFSLLVKA